MGGVCSDPKPPNFPNMQYLDSSDCDRTSDDLSDVQSFISYRSFRSPDARSISRSRTRDFLKAMYKNMDTNETRSGNIPKNDENANFGVSANSGMISVLKVNGRDIPSEEKMEKSSTSSIRCRVGGAERGFEDSIDHEAKSRLKEMIEPIIMDKMRQMIDKSVDELFMKARSDHGMNNVPCVSHWAHQENAEFKSNDSHINPDTVENPDQQELIPMYNGTPLFDPDSQKWSPKGTPSRKLCEFPSYCTDQEITKKFKSFVSNVSGILEGHTKCHFSDDERDVKEQRNILAKDSKRDIEWTNLDKTRESVLSNEDNNSQESISEEVGVSISRINDSVDKVAH